MPPSAKPIEVIPYFPLGYLSDIHWTHATHVLQHLLDHPNERARVLDAVQILSNGRPRSFILYHPLMNQDVRLNTNTSDNTFLHILRLLWIIEDRRQTEAFSL